MLLQQQVAVAQQHGPGNHALEFANVAGEVVATQQLQGAFGPVAGLTLQKAAGILDEAGTAVFGFKGGADTVLQIEQVGFDGFGTLVHEFTLANGCAAARHEPEQRR